MSDGGQGTATGGAADAGATAAKPALTALDRALLDRFQHELPLEPDPWGAIAEDLGTTADAVLTALARLREAGFISRVGAVVAPHQAGWSTLAAMAVPEDRLEDVAAAVNGFPEVNHNYEREHELNLWFVVAAADRARVAAVLDGVRTATGLDVLDLPLEEAWRLDLGFPLQWN